MKSDAVEEAMSEAVLPARVESFIAQAEILAQRLMDIVDGQNSGLAIMALASVLMAEIGNDADAPPEIVQLCGLLCLVIKNMADSAPEVTVQ